MPVPMSQLQQPYRNAMLDEGRTRVSAADRSKAQLDQELDATHAAGIEEEVGSLVCSFVDETTIIFDVSNL